MTTRYFNVKQGITTGNVTIDAASSNVSGVGNLTIVNNVIAGFLSGNGSALSSITGANVTGQVGNALVASTVYTNAQPNITSVGTLTSVTSTGTIDFTGASNVSLGPVGNVKITGGTTGQYLQTDGTGTLSWQSISSTSITNGNSNVSVAANGNVTISSTGNANVIVVSGAGANVTGYVNVAGNIYATNFIGNIAGNISGNIVIPGANTGVVFNDGGNANSSSAFTFDKTNNLVTVTANANIGNISSGGAIAATGNVSGGNLIGNNLTSTRVPYVGTNKEITDSTNLTWDNANQVLKIGAGGAEIGGDAGYGYVKASTANISGNANVGNLGTGGLITATGNITGGNIITGGVVTASGNISTTANASVSLALRAGSLISDSLTATGSNNLTITSGTGNANVVLAPTGTGTVDVSNKRITQVATPTQDTDAANKQYVDGVAQGLDVKASVVAATSAALASYTYNNGTSGVGATITASANGVLTIDGVNPSANARVLIKNETSTNQPYNGIYIVTEPGNAGAPFILTRTTDFDQGSPSGEIPGAFTFVEQGTSYADTGWVCTTNAPVTVGTTNIAFSQFSGAGQYTAGDGLALTGTTFSVNVDNSTIEISADTLKVKDGLTLVTPNIGVAGGTSLTASGNVSANNLSATNNVSAVIGSFTGNVSVGNLTTTGGISASTIAGNLTTATQANITTVGNLTGLTVTGVTNLGNVGNVIITGGSSGYILGTNGSGNLTWINAGSSGTAGSNTQVQFNDGGAFGASANFTFNKSTNTLSATNFAGNGSGLSSITGANVTGQVGNALVAGTVYTNAQPNITSVGSLSGLTVSNATGVVDFTTTANVTLGAVANLHISGGTGGQYLKTDGSGTLSWGTVDSSSIQSGNSNVNIPNANGNVNVSSAGNANVLVVAGNGIFVAGDGTFTGTLTAGNITSGAGNGGNITGANLISANFFQGNGSLLTSLTGANVTGQVGNALIAGTVYTAAQPNITSVGTLTSLVVSGNASASFIALNNGLTSNRSNVSVTTNTVVDQFAKTTFRTAKYVISASGDDGYQSVEALMVHDGTTAYITIYGSVCSNVSADIIDLSANINGVSANVSLYASSSSANAKVNIVASYINV